MFISLALVFSGFLNLLYYYSRTDAGNAFGQSNTFKMLLLLLSLAMAACSVMSVVALYFKVPGL